MGWLWSIITFPLRWLNAAEQDALDEWNRIGGLSNREIDLELRRRAA